MRLLLMALAGAAALLLGGCSGSGTAPAGGDGQGFVSGDGSIAVLDAGERQPAPELTGTTLTGEPFDLADHRGDVVVLNVWGSWCAPCREEAPYLQAVYEETRSSGVQFVGVNTRDDAAAAQAFERRFGVTYPSVVDDDGRLLLTFRDTLPPSSIPSTLLIDREGRVAARILGPTTFTELRALVDDVASETA